MRKSQAEFELLEDTNLGIAYGQGGGGIEIMTYREFLDWYADAGHERMDIREHYNDETGETEWMLITKSAVDSRKVFNREIFPTYEEAENEYYNVLERKHESDNGAGGFFYNSASELDDDSWDPEQDIYELEEVQDELKLHIIWRVRDNNYERLFVGTLEECEDEWKEMEYSEPNERITSNQINDKWENPVEGIGYIKFASGTIIDYPLF